MLAEPKLLQLLPHLAGVLRLWCALHVSWVLCVAIMPLYTLCIVNKAGGLIYNRVCSHLGTTLACQTSPGTHVVSGPITCQAAHWKLYAAHGLHLPQPARDFVAVGASN